MASIWKYLQMGLAWGLIGAVLVTLVAPSISRLLISAPVSFGMNCEPAANFSMRMLIDSQLVGLVLGLVVGIALTIFLKNKKTAQTRVAV